jgi:hypothetical protein
MRIRIRIQFFTLIRIWIRIQLPNKMAPEPAPKPWLKCRNLVCKFDFRSMSDIPGSDPHFIFRILYTFANTLSLWALKRANCSVKTFNFSYTGIFNILGLPVTQVEEKKSFKNFPSFGFNSCYTFRSEINY